MMKSRLFNNQDVGTWKAFHLISFPLTSARTLLSTDLKCTYYQFNGGPRIFIWVVCYVKTLNNKIDIFMILSNGFLESRG